MVDTQILRILPAHGRDGVSIASERDRISADGWILTGLLEGLCTQALEERCTLALHVRGRAATDVELALIRAALREAEAFGAEVSGALRRIDLHLPVSDATHTLEEVARAPRPISHFCAGPRCEGLPWPAEVLAHPTSCLLTPSDWPGLAAQPAEHAAHDDDFWPGATEVAARLGVVFSVAQRTRGATSFGEGDASLLGAAFATEFRPELEQLGVALGENELASLGTLLVPLARRRS